MKHKQSNLKFSAWNELLKVPDYIPQVSSRTNQSIWSIKSKIKRCNLHLQESVTSITFKYLEITCNSKADWITDRKTVWWHAHFVPALHWLQIIFRTRDNINSNLNRRELYMSLKIKILLYKILSREMVRHPLSTKLRNAAMSSKM